MEEGFSFTREYNSKYSKYVDLINEVEHILDQKFRETELKIHTLTSRIKTLDSLVKKIERKNLDSSLDSPFEEIEDIAGIRVVCLFITDIQKIGDIIKKNFEIVSEDNKINENNQVSSFGYMSLHYIAKLKNGYSGARYDHIKELKFEIQVRTISMDAWANISHYLDYKSENDIPQKLKKDFHALSGLFYVADSHFEFFMDSINKIQQETDDEIKEILSHEIISEDEKLNFDKLKSYLSQKYSDRERKEREVETSKATSELLYELLEAGYDNLKKLDDSLDKAKDAFLLYEELYPPSTRDKKFVSVGVVRISLNIIDEKFRAKNEKISSLSIKNFEDERVQSLIN
ncbi:GTP pyrophosphokinase [Exiguobacterium sp. NPDC077395]|uniref:GTP pyrophosphokinase n=1 Tax=Exiguobacterium sp. NPDC077395 TaxID=3390563 RepID=UPI003CFFB202